jgi:chromosome segregation ATPase
MQGNLQITIDGWLKLFAGFAALIGILVSFWHWLLKPLKNEIRGHRRSAVRRINGVGKRIDDLSDSLASLTSKVEANTRELDRAATAAPFKEKDAAETKALLDSTVLELDRFQVEIAKIQGELKQCLADIKRNKDA